jgi:hypothetical protein
MEAIRSSNSPGPATYLPTESQATPSGACASEASPWHLALDEGGHQQQQQDASTSGPTVEMSKSMSSAPAAPSPWSTFQEQQPQEPQQQQQQSMPSSSSQSGHGAKYQQGSSSSSSTNSSQPPGHGVDGGLGGGLDEEATAASSNEGEIASAVPGDGEQIAATQSSGSGWEMVDQQVVGVVGPSGGVEAVETVRNLVYRLGGEQGRTGEGAFVCTGRCCAPFAEMNNAVQGNLGVLCSEGAACVTSC